MGSHKKQLNKNHIDWMIEIKRIETGESAEYRLTYIQDDPEAR